jgi:drug/metabolite transporter (DMT)-like permease
MRTLRAVPWPWWFFALGLVWGCSFLFIKLGLEALTPVGVAFGRLAIGSVTLLLIARATGTRLPRARRTWGYLALGALLFCSIPFTLFAWGETQVSSILAGIVNACTPLTTLVVVLVAYPEERPTRERVAGLGIGFVGVLVVVGVWEGIGGSQLAGVLACVAAITCYGLAFPLTRRHLVTTGDGPISIAAGQVTLAALFLLPVVVASTVLGHPVVAGPPSATTILGMLALGSLGSGIAYVLNTHIVGEAGGTVASSVTYVTPLVSVSAGALLLAEPLTWHEPVGAAIVLLGVAVSQGRIPLPAALRAKPRGEPASPSPRPAA